MASSKEYLQFLLDQLSDLKEITYRMMMGEYILYYRGKIAAYVCDDRLLVKPVPAAEKFCPMRLWKRPIPGQSKCCWWKKWMTEAFFSICWYRWSRSCLSRKRKKQRGNEHAY